MTPVAGPGPSSPKPASLAFRIFEFFFLSSLFIFPIFLGAVSLWSFSLGTAVLCGAFAVYWFRQALREPGFLWSKLDRWIAVYLGFFLLSLSFSKIPYYSRIEFFKLMAVLTAYFATRYLCRGRFEIYRLSRNFVFLGGFLAIIALLQIVGALPHDWWKPSFFVASTYVNHNHFAGLLVLIIPIAFGLILAERDRAKRSFFIFLTVLMGVSFVFALSRGAFVALAVSMIWMMWMLNRRHLISKVFFPLSILFIFIVCAILIFGMEPIQQRVESIRMVAQGEDQSFKFRWITWLGTIPMIRDFFWFGSGPGTFGHLFLQFRPVGLSMRPVFAHNDYLHLLAECGIFAFLSAAVLVIQFFRRGSRIIRLDDSRLRIGVGSGVMAGILGLLVHALTDFNFHIPANWLLSAVAAGLLLSMDEVRHYGSKRLSGALKAMVSFSVAALIAGTFYFGISDYFFWEAKGLLKDARSLPLLNPPEKA